MSDRPTAPARKCRTLAVDYGRARIGLALCDALGLSARPLPALKRSQPEKDFDALLNLYREEEIEQLLFGLPLTLEGEEEQACEEVRSFATQLVEKLEAAQLPAALFFEDERLSSKGAHAVLKSAGLKHKRRKELVDSTAATLLLQSFLARLK